MDFNHRQSAVNQRVFQTQSVVGQRASIQDDALHFVSVLLYAVNHFAFQIGLVEEDLNSNLISNSANLLIDLIQRLGTVLGWVAPTQHIYVRTV